MEWLYIIIIFVIFGIPWFVGMGEIISWHVKSK